MFSVISAATPTAWPSPTTAWSSLAGQPSHLSLEGLRARQPAASDDPGGGGVLAPLPAPRASPGLRPHPPFRLSGPPTPRRALAPLLPVPGTTDRFAQPHQDRQPGEEEGCSTPPPSTSTWSCPQCGGPMIILERLTAAEMCTTLSTPSLREVLMKHSFSFRPSSAPSVPIPHVSLFGPTRHTDSHPLVSHPARSTLKPLLPPQFAAITSILPSAPGRPNPIQIP